MSNPYESPLQLAPASHKEPGPLPPPQEPGLAGHIRVVAVLMMVQGFFEVAFGAMMTIMAFVFPRMLGAMVAADAELQAEGGPDPESAASIMMVIYLVMGLAGVIPGLAHLVAGFRNVLYKGRKLGLIALGAGLVTLPMMICFPTALILAIYGMIVYFNPGAFAAFQMGEQGYSGEAIYATFFAGRAAK